MATSTMNHDAMNWRRWSGTSNIHEFSRFIVKRTVDVVYAASKTLGYSGRSRDLISGKIYDDVEKMLGTNHYKELCNQLTKLKNIHFCQSGIVTANTSHSPQPSPFFNHKCMILEVSYGPDMSERFYIRAEKTMLHERGVAIKTSVVKESERTEGQALLVSMQWLDKKIGIRDMQARWDSG